MKKQLNKADKYYRENFYTIWVGRNPEVEAEYVRLCRMCGMKPKIWTPARKGEPEGEWKRQFKATIPKLKQEVRRAQKRLGLLQKTKGNKNKVKWERHFRDVLLFEIEVAKKEQRRRKT